MAPPKKKATGQSRKERITEPRYSYWQRRKRPQIRRRPKIHETISVRDMVYRLLNVDKHNQGKTKNRVSKGSRKIRARESPGETSYDSSLLGDSSETVGESEYTKSVTSSVENLTRVMDAANTSAASSSGNSSVSNISMEPIVLAKTIDNTRALLKKKSLVQVINNYIRAGIEEGKRRAKRYIRKALSFGVKSGYLIPTDPQGQVIRVCPTLIQSRKNDIEARKRRRRARKGEENPFNRDGNAGREPTPPWDNNQKPYRESTPKPETSPKKRKRFSDTKYPYEVKRKKSPKKKSVERRTTGKKKKTKKKNNLTELSLRISSDISDENIRNVKRRRSSYRQEPVEGSENRRVRRAKSPRNRREKENNSHENRRVSSDEEDRNNAKFEETDKNGRPMEMVERRKSAMSQENVFQDHLPTNVDQIMENGSQENKQEDNVESIN